MGLFSSGKDTEYGYRLGKKETWCGSKSEAERAIRRMGKSVKAGGTAPKLIQRQVPAKAKKARKAEDRCSGGTCKRNNYCTKHAKKAGASPEYGGNIMQNGKNRNTARWDETGHRW